MIDRICDYLTDKIKNQMPEVDEQRAEIINYGIHLIIGEIPKTFIFIALAALLGVLKEFFITVLVVFPYRAFSGGFHLKTHFGCIVGTSLFYCGIPLLSRSLIIPYDIKYFLIIFVWLFGLIMCKLYAPADTENVPILKKKERRKDQILSYIILTITLAIGAIVKDNIISNIIILGIFLQTVMITKIAYKLTNNKYGYEVFMQKEKALI